MNLMKLSQLHYLYWKIKKIKYMTFTLPDLQYSYSDLEPHIDARTMEIHHSKHHNGYTSKLNAAIDVYILSLLLLLRQTSSLIIIPSLFNNFKEFTISIQQTG